MKCKECGLDNPDGNEFCCFCGAELQPEEKHEKDNPSNGGEGGQSQNDRRIRILPIVLAVALSIVLVIVIFNIRGCSDHRAESAEETIIAEETASGNSEAETTDIAETEEEAAAKKKAEEEAAAKKKAEEEAAAKKKAEEEEAARKKAEEEAAAKKKAEEEEAAKKKAEEEEAARKKAEEEAAAKKKAEEEEAARKKAEEEAAKKNSVPAISMDGIETISASSWKSEPEYGLYHVPENMIDGDLSTGWCEDAGGDGIGETVYLYFDKQYKVTGMDIYPGYHKSQDLFEKNGVPVKIKITGDHAETFTLNDEMKSQKLTFSEPMLTEKLTIEILKVRSGSKYKDTLITDIKMY